MDGLLKSTRSRPVPRHSCADGAFYLKRPGAEPVKVQIHPSVHATNGNLLRELALAGGGIILQPSFIVGAELMRGTLVPLLPDWKTFGLTLYAVYLSQRQLSPRVRAFIDYLVDRLARSPTGKTGSLCRTTAMQSKGREAENEALRPRSFRESRKEKNGTVDLDR